MVYYVTMSSAVVVHCLESLKVSSPSKPRDCSFPHNKITFSSVPDIIALAEVCYFRLTCHYI